MTAAEMIYHRKSFRNYSNQFLDVNTLRDIEKSIMSAKRLYPDIKISWEIIGNEKVKRVQSWQSPHYIAMFTEDVEGARENIGFVFQQVELYMQSIGIGSCWLGLGKLRDNGDFEFSNHSNMDCVMIMAFGTPNNEEYRNNILDFKRKKMLEITDIYDERLECARVAPSAVNSQPWYFLHTDGGFHIYCASKYLIHKVLGKMNKIDMGISLAHLYMENKESFEFFKFDSAPQVNGYYYIGSVKI